MSCRRSHEIDLAEYLVEPTAPRWAEFRAHYPTCADCSLEVARWANLEHAVRAASTEPGRAHPAEELLLAFHRSPEDLDPDERVSLGLHLEGCPACRDALAALDAFDFSALEPARSRLRGLVFGLGEWLKSLGGPIPTPALVMTLLLLLAIPAGLAVWSAVRGRSPLPPDTTAALSPPRPPVAVEPAAPVSELEPEAEAPGEFVPLAPRIAARPVPPVKEEAAGSQREDMAIAMAEWGTPLYAVPPGSVGPARRISRMRAVAAAVPSLVALVPDHVGLTLHQRPTLYWFISEDTDLSARLTLRDEKSIDPVLEFTVDGPLQAGIHSVRLSDHDVRLEPSVRYEWFVSLAKRGEPRAYAALSGGAIRRIEPSDNLRAEIGASAPSHLGHVYAQRGFWYDALAVFSRWVERAPAEGTMRDQRAALLEQAGLDEAADFDRSSPGASKAK